MSRTETDVLVVGAGPTGLMMASELARHGVRHRLVERLAGPPRVAKATAIMPRTMEVLEDVGCLDPFLSSGVHIHDMVTYAGGPDPILSMSFDGITSPYPFLLCQEQFRTEDILRAHLDGLGGRIERGVDLLSLTQDDECVRAELHTPTGPETVVARYVAGCDGAHSTVRHALGFEFPGAAYPSDFILGHVRLDWDMPRDRVAIFLAEIGTVFTSPLPDGRWLLISDLGDGEVPEHAQREPTVEDLQRALSDRVPGEVHVSDPMWASFFRIHHRQVERYSQGRAFLAGDAAHIHSPIGGQGMNTGLQDAYNLAWKLALVLNRGASPELLESYQAERHPVGKKVQALTHQLQVSQSFHNPVLQGVRNAVMRCMGHLEIVGHYMANQLGETLYTYRGGPLAEEHCDPGFHLHHDARHPGFRDCKHFFAGPHAGCRAPDAALDGHRLFELLRGPQFTLLLFEGTHPSAHERPDLERLADDLEAALPLPLSTVLVTALPRGDANGDGGGLRVVHDVDLHAHEAYGARGQCLYLVRPDGYVAYRSQPVGAEGVVAFARQRLGLASATAAAPS